MCYIQMCMVQRLDMFAAACSFNCVSFNGGDFLNYVAVFFENSSLLSCQIQANAFRRSFRVFDEEISAIGTSSSLRFNVRRCCAVPLASRRKERVLRTPPPGPL